MTRIDNVLRIWLLVALFAALLASAPVTSYADDGGSLSAIECHLIDCPEPAKPIGMP